MEVLNTINGKIKAFIKEYASILIISLIVLLCIEILNHPNNNLVQALTWMWTHKRVLLLNYIIYVNIGLLFYLIINRLKWSNIIYSSLFIIIGICNYYKLELKGENVVLWDVLNLQAAAGVMTEIKFDITWRIVFAVICLIGIIIWQLRCHPKQHSRVTRKNMLIASFICLTTLTVGVVFNNRVLESIKITNMDWNQDKNYRENGFLLSFFMNLKDVKVDKPRGYSKEAVDEAIKRIDQLEIENQPKPAKKPNIIAVMAESFSDITIANKGLTFEEDLLPNIHRINNNIVKGDLLVSIFGGGTANTEFEFLTGNSMAHLPIGSVAYNRYITDHCDSLVGTLKQQGYSTYAIHPYLKTFWHRDKIYPLMGFDHFESEEDFSNNVTLKKGYISDDDVYHKIIECYKQRNQDQPFFSFSVTMENHTPYSDPSNGKVPLDGDVNSFKEDQVNEAMIHAKGVQDGDQLFGNLVDYFSKSDEPTIVVIFGDHHPFLSSTVNKNADNLDEINRFKTPYAIWANYDIPTHTNLTIDSSMLGAYTLYNAGIPLPNYLKFNLLASQYIAGYNNYFILDRNNNVYHHQDDLPKNIQQFYKDHELLQYDLMFGKRYGEKYLWDES